MAGYHAKDAFMSLRLSLGQSVLDGKVVLALALLAFLLLAPATLRHGNYIRFAAVGRGRGEHRSRDARSLSALWLGFGTHVLRMVYRRERPFLG